MRLSHDYTDFFDLHRAGAELAHHTREDFVTGCARFLTRLGVAPEPAASIAQTLYRHMAEPGRHYHTAVHVLAMFGHAEKAGVDLSDAERLAVWFHDSIYDPAAKGDVNENASADWMLDVLGETDVDRAVLDQAADIIRTTAHHLDDDVPAAHATVMDLDLAGLAAQPENFDRQSAAVRDEFADLPDERYNAGKVAFFSGLLERKQLYRTPPFAGLESTARRQIRDEIKRLSGSNGRH